MGKSSHLPSAPLPIDSHERFLLRGILVCLSEIDPIDLISQVRKGPPEIAIATAEME